VAQAELVETLLVDQLECCRANPLFAELYVLRTSACSPIRRTTGNSCAWGHRDSRRSNFLASRLVLSASTRVTAAKRSRTRSYRAYTCTIHAIIIPSPLYKIRICLPQAPLRMILGTGPESVATSHRARGDASRLKRG